MFETNDDIDLSDDIFNFPKVPAKRHSDESETADSKRICLPPKPPSTKAQQLLEKIANAHTNIRKIVPRKFPGPAGLLSYTNKPTESLRNQPEEIICSQLSADAFNSDGWLRMLEDFGQRNDRNVSLPEKYNIGWIKRCSMSRKLVDQKAPFLAAVVQSVESTKEKASTVTLHLKDVTGEIRGSIQQSLFDEYSEGLIAGSVIVLQHFSVLTTNFGKNHYATITGNNLVAIYREKRGSSWGEVDVFRVRNVATADLFQAIEEVRKKVRLQGETKRLSISCNEEKGRELSSYVGNNVNRQSCRGEMLNEDKKEVRQMQEPKRFNFKAKKRTNVFENSTQVERKSNSAKLDSTQLIITSQSEEHRDILQDVLGDLDVDSLFGDF